MGLTSTPINLTSRIGIAVARAHTMQPATRVAANGSSVAGMDCTPTATLTALKLTGAPLGPELADGSVGADEALRYMALGDAKLAVDHSYGIYPSEMQRATDMLGAHTSIVRSMDDILQAVEAGRPAVVSGDAHQLHSGSTGPYAAHSVTLAGFDAARGQWLLSDPARSAPTEVSDSQLRQFLVTRPAGGASIPSDQATYPALVWDTYVARENL